MEEPTMQEKIPLSQGRHFQGKRRITCVSKAANRSNKMKSEIGFSDRKVIGEFDNGGFSGLVTKA